MSFIVSVQAKQNCTASCEQENNAMFLSRDTSHYLFTPWSTVLIEKLIGSQLVKKFSSFRGTRRFIIAFTSARHLSLSWASSIQSINVARITLSRSVFTAFKE